MSSIILCLIVVLTYIVGLVIVQFLKKKKQVNEILISTIFMTILITLAFYLIPKISELLMGKNELFMYIFMLIGIVIIKLIDFIIPSHLSDEYSKEQIHHLSIVLTVILVLFNIIGVIFIDSQAINIAVRMVSCYALCSIPFACLIFKGLNTKKSKFLVMSNLIGSVALGLLITLLIKNIKPFILGSLLSISAGMFVYMILFELMETVFSKKKSKYKINGIIIGVIVGLVALVIGG